MLANSADPAVAERPELLLASGGAGAVAASRPAFESIVATLKTLENNETLLIDSGRPAGVCRSNELMPRVVITGACNNAARERSPDTQPGAIMWPEGSGRSWTYTGPQGSLHTAYEVLAAIRRKHWPDGLQGMLVVSGGLGGMGGSLPLATTLHGAAFLGIEADAEKITRRIREGYCDYCVNSLDEALRILKIALRQRQAVSVGLAGNCAEVVPELARRGVLPDILTDQTCADDPLNGYIPAGLAPAAAALLRQNNPSEYLKRSCESIALHVQGMLVLANMGAVTFEMGNGIRAAAHKFGGVENAFGFPGFEAWLEPLLSAGCAPFIWIALSGRAEDLRIIEDSLSELFPEGAAAGRWIRLVRKHARSQGLPARMCWMDPRERAAAALLINKLAGAGNLRAPVALVVNIVNRTARNEDASALLNALRAESPAGEGASAKLPEIFSGASWVALEEGAEGPLASTCVYLADGSPQTLRNLERALAGSASAIGS